MLPRIVNSTKLYADAQRGIDRRMPLQHLAQCVPLIHIAQDGLALYLSLAVRATPTQRPMD
jgi:hypothetical protein